MAERHSELSSVAILAIAIVIAAAGGAVYLLATPISPAKMVALEHAAINQPLLVSRFSGNPVCRLFGKLFGCRTTTVDNYDLRRAWLRSVATGLPS